MCSCQAAIPETDDTPAESPWNLNDWVVDFANGGTLGWTALNTQVDGFLNALDQVNWDNALYVCYSIPARSLYTVYTRLPLCCVRTALQFSGVECTGDG